MKKTVLIFISTILIFFGIGAYAAEIDIYIDDVKLESDVLPKNVDGRVLVPMRTIFEQLNSDVSWDGNSKTVFAEHNGEVMSLAIDSDALNTGVRNSVGEIVWIDKISLDVPAKIIDDSTYVPIRAVSEALGARVSWNEALKSVSIDTAPHSNGNIYYSSNADYQRLYATNKNSTNRQKISDKSVCELEMFGDYVYYITKSDNYLCRANINSGEEVLIGKPVNKIAVSDEWIYYQERENSQYSGKLYKMNIASGETVLLVDKTVEYPQKYGDYIYFNFNNDNAMYGISVNDNKLVKLSLGDNEIKLYPFNCFYHGGYLFVENGAWYGNIFRITPEGEQTVELNSTNSVICKNQTKNDKLIYINQDNGKSVCCMNVDGSDLHTVIEVDPSWVDVELCMQTDDVLYYKNPLRREIYRVNIDGSDNKYVCYADEIKTDGKMLVTSYNGLYLGNLDASDLKCVYEKPIKNFEINSDGICFTDAQSGKMYFSDFTGSVNLAVNDSVGEWVCE